jgi:hypothetical protein
MYKSDFIVHVEDLKGIFRRVIYYNLCHCYGHSVFSVFHTQDMLGIILPHFNAIEVMY